MFLNCAALARRAMGAVPLLIAAFAAPALAQTGPRIIDSGRLDQGLPSPPLRAPAPSAAEGAAGIPEAVPVPLIASVRPFRLSAVRLEGAEAVPAGALEPAWRAALGQEVGATGIIAIARAVEARLEALGYALRRVTVPAQDLQDGVLRIRVLLGHISEVTFAGDAAPAASAVAQAQAERLKTERPLRQDTLERALALMARTPGVTVDTAFEPTADPLGLRLRLDMRWRPIELSSGANNLGSVPLGRTQFDVGLGLNGLAGVGDRTNFVFAMPGDARRFRYYGLNHVRPIGTNGLTMSLSAGLLRTRQSNTTMDGEATTFGLGLSYPLILRARREVTLDAAFDGVNSESALLGFTISNERTRTLRLGATFADQVEGSGTTVLRAVLSTGLEVLGARAGHALAGGPDFSKAVLQVYREQELPGPFVLRLTGLGQIADRPLPASEALLFGGQPFGRGFPQASLQGDSGVLGGAELALKLKWIEWTSLLTRPEIFGFADAGELWLRDAAKRWLPERVSAASAGFGVRATLFDRVTADLTLGRGVAEDTSGMLQPNGWQFLFSLRSALPGPLR